MAKETTIIFVYDTECCKTEADDPISALLYFNPHWVSDTQKLSLCGQIMGAVQFLSQTFGKPKVVALQNGRFVIKEYGRYLVVIGTDRNVNQSLLEQRADILNSLIKLFHNNLQTISDEMTIGYQGKTTLPERLFYIFETFLPMLTYRGNVFRHMPIAKLPKSASNIFLDAIHTLQSCQRNVGVFGGMISHHNKIIASQLSTELAKYLTLADPHRVKTASQQIAVNFHVPVGCQLIAIYITNAEYVEMCANAERARAMCITHETNANTYQLQYKKKLMKRDKSMVFTNPIPEETVDGAASTSAADTSAGGRTDEPAKCRPQSLSQRPNHLPLRFKNVTARDIPESGFSSSITFDEHDSFPQFIGRTSVCSTPMTENKLLQGNIVPICGNPFGEAGTVANIAEERPTQNDLGGPTSSSSTPPPQPQPQQSSNAPDDRHKLDKTFDEFTGFVHTAQPVRRNSLIDIGGTFRTFLRQMKMKPTIMNFMADFDTVTDGLKYCQLDDVDGLKHRHQLNAYLQNYWSSADRTDSADYDADIIDDIEHAHPYKTITDPTYPMFNSSGQPISHFLFEEMCNRRNASAAACAEAVPAKDVCGKVVEQPTTAPALKATERPASLPPGANSANRKSLSLPLKSMTTSNGEPANTVTPSADAINSRSALVRAEDRRRLSGIQLTPLISKLSILAMTEERSSGFSSWDTTPGIEVATPIDGGKLFRRRSSIRADDVEPTAHTSDSSKSGSDIEANGQLRRVELFVCGQNNMTMLMVVQDGFVQKQENVQTLFDVCISKLPRLEQSIGQTLGANMSGDKTEGSYSYSYVDHEWDTLEAGGPWSPFDLTSMEQIRHDLNINANLRSIIVRDDESVIYGHKHISSNVFYKQQASAICGLPAPADAMGSISRHAHRSLERDHSIILF